MDNTITREAAVEANKKVHSLLVNAGEYQKSPHFNEENINKVTNIVKTILNNLELDSTLKAVDFGCGTGFMINIIHKYFDEVHGVDITRDMMKYVDLTPGNIQLHECLAENTPFEANTFEFATAYSFMDHLIDYETFLREVYRVLKKGGIFYSDLNPNRAFISSMKHAEIEENVSDLIQREINGALYNGKYYEENFNVDARSLEAAEPIKTLEKGFDHKEIKNICQKIGFTNCKIEYEWFVGQGKIHHTISPETAEHLNEHLQSLLPISSNLFKYLRIICIK